MTPRLLLLSEMRAFGSDRAWLLRRSARESRPRTSKMANSSCTSPRRLSIFAFRETTTRALFSIHCTDVRLTLSCLRSERSLEALGPVEDLFAAMHANGVLPPENDGRIHEDGASNGNGATPAVPGMDRNRHYLSASVDARHVR